MARRPSTPRGISGANGGPTLTWPDREWKVGEAPRSTAISKSIEIYAGKEHGGPHRFLVGDTLDVAGSLLAEGLGAKVDLVYVDPPFASQSDYVHEARLDGSATGRVVRSVAYGDKWAKGGDGRDGVAAYLDELAPRLELMTRLLSPRGTLWVHLDWRAGYLVRAVLDEILGRDAFLNEIVWRRAPNLGRQAASGQFGRTLDTILVYGKPGAVIVPPTRPEKIDKSSVRIDDQGRAFTTSPRGDYTDASIARLDAEGRVHRTATGRVYIKYFLFEGEGGEHYRERRVDTLWTDIAPLRHAPPSERTGFPTQKPRALLERIIACATNPGDLVADLFAGSGTTAEAAHAIGRRSISGDRGELSLATARARFLRAGMGFTVDAFDGAAPKLGTPPEVRVSRRGDANDVELVSPVEPLGWAIDADHDPARGFRATWHAQRSLGARAVQAPREASVPAGGAGLAVRVFHDDGAVAQKVFA